MGQGEKPTPTPQQWEVIRETDRHILVAAGAGTGKTFTVVSKVLYLLGEEVCGKRCAAPLALRDIAAITFTNKAAAELKEKLRDALKKAGRRAESREVDGARVGTIHSFCGDILRELALRGGHAPSPRLLDDAEGALLRAEVVRETLLEAVTADAASPEAIPALNDLLSTWSVKEVERWMAELLDQGDQLRALAARAEAHGALEGALVRLASRAAARLGERLRDAGQMDFDRMITWTRDLIRSEPAVRRALQQRIRVLVIDEFQDVDPVQKEIAYLLGEPESGRADTTRLVLVGDPKQSIYRFRRADVKVWRAVERDFTERGWGAVLPLAENRRSVPGVLGFVDHAIGKLLDTPLGGDGQMRDFEVPYASVAPVRPDNDGVPAVEMLVVPPDENGKCRTADPVRRSEAAAVARRARELNEQGVPWKEMAVLLSGWGALDIYRGALEREGIPTYALRASGFYERPEITDIVVALQAIRDPHDDRVLVGFLRGPFVCVSDETLLRIARQTPVPCWPALGSVVLDDPEEAARLARGRRLLERLSAARDRIPVAELLHELLEESGYLAHLALLGASGKQKIANVRKLLRMLAARPEASASDVILAIERARELELLEGEARLYGEKDDVLTITSIHSAKGLEWGTVFWCDLVRAGTDGRSKLAVAGEELRLAVPEVETDEQPDDWKRIRGLAKEEREAEAKRLWYVAATRAKDRLVLSGIPLGSGGRLAGSPAGAIKGLFPGLDEGAGAVGYVASEGREFFAVVRVIEVLPDEAESGAASVSGIGDQALGESGIVLAGPPVAVSVAAGRTRHSATELMARERCGRRHWFRYVLGGREPGVERPRPEDDAEEPTAGAIARGLIVHDVLERWEEEAELDALLEDAIGRWDSEAPVPEGAPGRRYRAVLREELSAVLARPEYRAVLDRPGARRELGFVWVREAGCYIEGKIDLIAPGPDGYEIIDIKTGACAPDVARVKAEGYGVQRAVYVSAVEAISGKPVGSFALEFSGAGVRVGGSLSEEGRKGARGVGGEAVGRLDATPGLAGDPAECSFCGYREAGWCVGAGSSDSMTTRERET